MKGIKLVSCEVSHEDERGRIYNKPLEVPLKELAVLFRKKGAVSGRHYHKGIHPSKNPERFFIVHGEMELYAKDLKTGDELTEKILPVTEIQISPNIYHELRALTDAVFLELRIEQGGYDEDVFRIR